MSENASVKNKSATLINRYEYEIVLFVFILLRFVFKNILSYKLYFTQDAVFGSSDTFNIVSGTLVVVFVSGLLSILFGKIIRLNGTEYEKPVIMLTALFFACPATLPFLFDISAVNGTNILYPFAVFIIALFLIANPILKWAAPFICGLYLIPSLFSQHIFFLSLRNWAALYVPLLLLFLFLEMMSKQIEKTVKKKSKSDDNLNTSLVLDLSIIVSAGAFIYSLSKGGTFNDAVFNVEQNFDLYLFIALLIIAPALGLISAVIYKAAANKYVPAVIAVAVAAPVLLVFLTSNNYYGIWVPFLIISLFFIVFYSIWHKNTAMLSAVRAIGDYLAEHRFAFYIILIAMASTTNISTNYLSEIFQKIFTAIPY